MLERTERVLQSAADLLISMLAGGKHTFSKATGVEGSHGISAVFLIGRSLRAPSTTLGVGRDDRCCGNLKQLDKLEFITHRKRAAAVAAARWGSLLFCEIAHKTLLRQ